MIGGTSRDKLAVSFNRVKRSSKHQHVAVVVIHRAAGKHQHVAVAVADARVHLHIYLWTRLPRRGWRRSLLCSPCWPMLLLRNSGKPSCIKSLPVKMDFQELHTIFLQCSQAALPRQPRLLRLMRLRLRLDPRPRLRSHLRHHPLPPSALPPPNRRCRRVCRTSCSRSRTSRSGLGLWKSIIHSDLRLRTSARNCTKRPNVSMERHCQFKSRVAKSAWASATRMRQSVTILMMPLPTPQWCRDLWMERCNRQLFHPRRALRRWQLLPSGNPLPCPRRLLQKCDHPPNARRRFERC